MPGPDRSPTASKAQSPQVDTLIKGFLRVGACFCWWRYRRQKQAEQEERESECKPSHFALRSWWDLSQAVRRLNFPLCKMIRILKQGIKKKKLETQQLLNKKLCSLTITQPHVGEKKVEHPCFGCLTFFFFCFLCLVAMFFGAYRFDFHIFINCLSCALA